ncbi:acetoin reductase family protein [Flammula alnicola]|nr:acetoin reductase family protein [Flammula alnicola]
MFPLAAKHVLRSSPILSRAMSTTGHGLSRVAIITGASKGIGRAIAIRLSEDGYDVALNDLPSAEPQLQQISSIIQRAGRRAIVVPGDVSVESDVKNLVSSTVEGLGSVDAMIANAGICYVKTLADTTVEDWDKMFSINARGAFLCYKYAAEQMISQARGGRIIGASSIAGKKGIKGLCAYGGTKFAVRGLTQTAAQELGPYGITVNAYAPGPIQTDMLDSMKVVASHTSTDVVDVNKSLTALGYDGKPDDIAGLVSYLASPASRFITGQSIAIDGGMVFD